MVGSTVSQERVDDALNRVDQWRSENHCPGISIAIIDGSETITTAGFGYRQLNPKEPATETTRYAVASVTKPVTALATLSLADEYGIDLDDPVAEYVPYFSDVPGEPITVKQLLTHTSGMPDDDLALLGEDVSTWDDFREFIAGTTDRRLADRERWLYYNSGYAVLARLIEVVAGTIFPAFVEDAVFDPLGMEASSFAYDVLDRQSADVMAGYSYDGEEFQEESFDDNKVLAGAGGLVSTVDDLAIFVAGHMGDDPAIDRGLVTRSPAVTRRELVDGTTFSYGYGWELRPFGSDTLVCHSGNTGISGGFVGFLVDHGVGISLGFNAEPASDPTGLGQAVLATLLGKESESVDPVRSIERDIQALTGQYESHTGAHTATVRWSDPALEFSLGGDVAAFEREFLPTSIDSGYYRFTSAEHVESTIDLEFFESDSGIDLLFDQLLFRRTEDTDE